jgi:hypothetical protein
MEGETEGRRLPAEADLRLPGARTPRRGLGGFAGTAELGLLPGRHPTIRDVLARGKQGGWADSASP